MNNQFLKRIALHVRQSVVNDAARNSRRFTTNSACNSAAASAQHKSDVNSHASSEFAPATPPPPPTPNMAEIKQTPLYELHKELGGKMVDFAGYRLPVYYSDASITESHLWTRKHASIFDVSHMQQVAVRGSDRFEFIESITVADMKQLTPNSGAYSLMPNDSGGIIDDLILMNCESPAIPTSSWHATRLKRMLSTNPTVTRTIPKERVDDNHIFMVLNAACAVKDLTHIMNKLEHFHSLKSGADVTVEPIEERALIALQGPETHSILQPLLESPEQLDSLYFMQTTLMTVAGIIGCRVTRCGYTGEDGVEISVDAARARDLVEALLSSRQNSDNNEGGGAKLAGLGARDTLRLEAGLCLYGNDIDERTTPVEAGLMWTISKRRRAAMDFPGAEVIIGEQFQRKHLVPSKRVGLIQPSDAKRGLAFRAGNKIFDAKQNDAVIGRITSGAPSPTLGVNIAMGYVGNVPEYTKAGARVQVQVGSSRDRGAQQLQLAQVTALPFVPLRYRLPPKKSST